VPYVICPKKDLVNTVTKGLIYSTILYFVFLTLPATADTARNLLGDAGNGSRSNVVHNINLFDGEGQKIAPDDEPLLPFSTRQTCGACHSYDRIATGWHFNANRRKVAPGRVGQAWIYVDRATATQLPLSYRPWPGTFAPEQAGLTPWKFAQVFGRQMPYPVSEADESEPDFDARWMVSGEIEINCLACHDAERAHDQAAWAAQIAKQNFRWAAAAASGFASAGGSAKDMPDMYDPFMPPVLDDPMLIPPSVSYDHDRFDDKGRVFVDIATKIPVERCYFCHSNKDVGTEKWASAEDVHLAAGLVCVDCHRNGLDHAITRGYEGAEAVSNNPPAGLLSCEGCHLPSASSEAPTSGRLGAPKPRHAGIPTVHFDKLACTACHSGPWPGTRTIRTKTARAHGLGTHNVNKANDALPHIVYPVFIRQSDGKIAPHKVVWPAFWGRLKDGAVTPIAPETVASVASKVFSQARQASSGDWLMLTDEQVVQVLILLSARESDKGGPVYISGGTLGRLNEAGRLIEAEHPAAGPYGWPIAHDVRPAAQSLGVRGCDDCHATDAPFFFGAVELDSPLASQAGRVSMMTEFEGIDPVYAKAFAFSFVFRPWLKIVIIISSAVVAAVLLLYALKALACLARVFAGHGNEPD
jgi:hypothetical protein